MTATYDIGVKHGTLVDPATGIVGKAEIGITSGRIEVIAPSVDENRCRRVVDASDCFVSPGFIDLHAHVWWGVAHLGIEPDPSCIRRGVTTVVDAGSAGSNTFLGFRRYVTERADTRVLAFLNISGMGQLDAEIGELQDLRWARVDRAVEMAKEHSDIVVGVKVRLSEPIVGPNCLPSLELAAAAASELSLPLMVHIGNAPLGLGEILARLKEGDIITHSFTGHRGGILDKAGQLHGAAREARERGVVFDVGHGAGSFSFEVAELAMSHGFLPDTISSDVHAYNVHGPVFDLVTTLTKFLALGVPLEDVVGMATAAPARAIGWSEKAGTIRVGGEADLTIFRMDDRPVALRDAMGVTRISKRLLVPVTTIKSGMAFETSAPGVPLQS